MKLLITGAGGFLGRRAASHFSGLGYQVLTPSRQELDITDRAAVDAWFRTNQPHTVLHCAAVSDTGACQREPERTAAVNVGGSINLAQACARTGAKLVFCSSDQIYSGSPLPGPHSEAELPVPNTVYGRQKLLAEQECIALCSDIVCLRLSWMYASHPLPGEHGHLLTSLCAALQDPSLPLTWPIHDRRGITNVDTVIRNLPAALELPAGIYNFGAENDADTFHTIQAVFAKLGLENAAVRLKPNLQAFSDSPRDIRMDGSLAKSYQIVFESTRAGLCQALSECI